jgi:hypothetical protein
VRTVNAFLKIHTVSQPKRVHDALRYVTCAILPTTDSLSLKTVREATFDVLWKNMAVLLRRQ